MPYLDPTLDVVFKLLLTRKPVLLRDMLQGILARPVGEPAILNPGIPGELAGDKQIVLDIRAMLADRSRVDLEMQRCTVPALIARFIYYVARDYSNQLRRGEKYHLLTPTIGIIWLAEPMVPALDRFHSVFELRERHTNRRLTDHLAIHLIQLSAIPSEDETDEDEDATRVRRWARFFAARDEAELDRLAQEDPIMEIAKNTLEQLSLDPSVRRQLLERERTPR
ncbi:MAG: Rpn family recombination-promoting nuclease/putative transposase [Myxococcota bacterium]